MGELTVKNFINSHYIEESFQTNFLNCWRNNGEQIFDYSSKNKGLKIHNSPYNCAFLPNMLKDVDLLNYVLEELQDLNLQYKNNDLYKFKCTEDLKGVKKPNIQKLCKYIEGPLMHWMQKVTGLQLNKKVAIISSKYEYSDVLLCHDDELEGRRIAFIIYMVPSWEKVYGGSLDLFSVDESNRPYRISQRLYPKFNSLAFFEVSPVSFHQVSEVITDNVSRISINGWFHGAPIEYPPRPILKPSIFIPPGEIEEHIIYSWINSIYLDQNTQAEVRKEFHEKSEIQLSDFLKQTKYKQLTGALRGKEMVWMWAGPPNKRHVEVASRNNIPSVLQEYLSLMESDAIFLVLSQLTGLELHHLAPQIISSSEDSNCDNEPPETISGPKVSKVKSFSKVNEGEPSCESNSRKRKNKTKKLEKKRKLEDALNTDTESQDGPNYGIGGLLDVGWESAVDDNLTSIAATRTRDEKTKAEVSSEVRRWRWGAYSLMRDDDLQGTETFTLDAMLFCSGSPNWTTEYGGGTVYVAKGEEEELLTVIPVPNTLTLVYRDKDTFRFTKHINVKSNKLDAEESTFYEILCEYRERK